jgi:hypothetical protein
MKQDFVTMHLVDEEFPQFNRKSQGTLMFEKPEATLVISAMMDSIAKLKQQKFKLMVGAAFLHPQDRLNKKEGRKIALSRMKNVEFTVNLQHMYGFTSDAVFFVLEGIDQEAGAKYTITVKIYKDSRKLRVVGASMRSWE